MPLAREGGWVVAWKREEERGGLRAELRDAGSIIRATGGGRPEVVVVEAAGLPGHRLVMVPKERPTPASYPRPTGVRRRREHRAQGSAQADPPLEGPDPNARIGARALGERLAS